MNIIIGTCVANFEIVGDSEYISVTSITNKTQDDDICKDEHSGPVRKPNNKVQETLSVPYIDWLEYLFICCRQGKLKIKIHKFKRDLS